MIPLIAILTMLDSIHSGNKKDVQRLSYLIGFGVLYGIYSIINSKQDMALIILMGILDISYLIQLIYLIFSKDMKKLFKYYDKRNSLKWIWNWSGKCVGYEEDGYLWSEEGKVIGKFFENGIYSPNGLYIGEVSTNGRIGINKSKKSNSKEPFEINQLREPIEKVENTSGLMLYANVDDF